MAVYDWLGWAIYGVVGLVVVGFCSWFIKYYKLHDEPSGVTGFIGFMSLLFALLSLFLIPIDVYMCSSYDDGNNYRDAARYTYYTFYIIFLFCLFVAIPFGYFYYEELGDIEDRSNTFAKKACSAAKYSMGTAILWVTLIVIGMFVSFNSSTPDDGDDAWTHQVASRFTSNVSHIMPFCIAVVTAIGMFFSMVYTSWGLAAFPVSLFKRIRAYQQVDGQNLQVELKVVRNDLDLLYTKYRGKDNWPPKDKAKKNALERRKKTLERAEKEVSEEDFKETCCEKFTRCFWNAAAPIRYLVGIALLGFSLLLVVSVTMHLIDQVVHSSCGYSCGFALNDPKLAKYDPISWMLTNCAKVFPFDYIFFSGIIFWLFWCTIFALMKIDVRFLCMKLFSLRPHQTMHNALLMAIGFLILILTSFNYLMMSLAAQYMTFGDQGTDCSIKCNESDSGCKECPGTEIYYLLSGILIGMPIFGLVYFVFSWIFVLIFFVSLVFNLYRKPKPKNRLLRKDSDDDLEAIFKD